MNVQTVFLIVLAVIIALGLVLFQYHFRSKKRGKLRLLLSFLRFLSLFGLLLLFINPKFSKYEYTVEKPNLVVLTDNSTSIEPFENEVWGALDKIGAASELSNRFVVKRFNFGEALAEGDSLSFTEANTDIGKALATINDIYSGTNTAVVLLTDGNQTLGTDYGFMGKGLKPVIFPVVIGDTTRYEDIAVAQVNSNRYAFLKNKYPVEVYLSYHGAGVRATVNISINGQNVYRENITFPEGTQTQVIHALLEASSIGVKKIEVSVSPLENERNTANNKKSAIVEVIDERTNIAIISDMLHPDIGALKKSIESNEQRFVTILKSSTDLEDLAEVDLFILYQPDASFEPIYNYIQQKMANVFTITGKEVDIDFLNEVQSTFIIDEDYPVMETFAILNPTFSKFDISDFSVENFPPLNNGAGIVTIGNGEPLLQMKVMGAPMESPLLAVSDQPRKKEALLFGENIWKWRMQSFRNEGDFKNFDDFMGKIVLYLSATKSKNRLDVDYKSIYEGSNNVKISATYFDEAFVFDRNVEIVVKVKGEDNTIDRQIPMLLKGSFYEADLSGLPPGNYEFTVTVGGGEHSESGSFTILSFDVEQQFASSDYKKLRLLSGDSKGRLYFSNQTDTLIQSLIHDDEYIPMQQGQENIVSLIDFRLLLGIIVAALSLEWAIRKYNGLI